MDRISPEQLSLLIDEHGASLVLYAQQWCDGPEDVVQEVFIKLMRQQPVPTNLVGWLYRVVRNGAISESRASSRRVRYERNAGARNPSWFETAAGEQKLDAEEATAALQHLPPDEREVVVLRIWGGLSFEEIAEVVGKSSSTAHRRYLSGLEALREKWSISCQE